MRLQPTKSPRQTKSSSGMPNHKLIFIVIAIIVIVVVLIVFSVVRDVSTLQDNRESLSDSTSNTVSTVDTITQIPQTEPVIVDNDAPGLTNTQISDISVFHKRENGFVFDADMQFSKATTLAESNSIAVGDELSILPIRTCVYHFDGNRIDISHTSGANLSIMRGYCKDDLDTAAMDADLQENIAGGKAKDIRLANVYIGNTVCGRYGTGQVDIDGTTHRIVLAYVRRDKEVYSFIGLVEPEAEDFLDLLLSNVYISSRSLIFE